jgi:hypothetical protein
MKISRRSLAASLILFVSMITGASFAEVDRWQKCSTGAVECPFFFDLYPKNKAFRTTFDETIRRAGIRKPSWLSRSTASPAELLQNDGGTRFLLFACEPHNCTHAFFTIYDPRSGLVRGLYVLEGNMKFFGELSADEKNILLSKFN